MATNDTRTQIIEGGLRYKSKVAGSPFKPAISIGISTKSCFLCGKHRGHSYLRTRNFFGTNQAVCAPSCKEVESILAAPQTATEASKTSTET